METPNNPLLPARIDNQDDKIHKDLYEKINENTNAVSALRATVQVLTTQNERFFELIEKKDQTFMSALRWIGGLFAVVVLALLFAIIYGAIGQEGLKSVRESLPTPTQSSKSDIAPAPFDDLQAWMNDTSAAA